MIKYLILKDFTVAINMDSGLSTMIDGHVTDLNENVRNVLNSRGFFNKIQYNKIDKSTMTIVNPTICISSACNLKCKYCYRSNMDISTNTLPFQTAKKFIDSIISIYPDYEYLRIDLTGYGEPLLAFSEIKKLVIYAEERSTSNKKIDIGFTTNGVLLNDEIIDYLEQHKIYYGISIDGLKKQNDAYRKGYNIRSVFDLVDLNISKVNKKNI